MAAYFILPETENRTLEDIELHFSDNNRRLIDIDIQIGTQLLTATTKPSDGLETQKLVRTWKIYCQNYIVSKVITVVIGVRL